jgi:hypothetical protein
MLVRAVQPWIPAAAFAFTHVHVRYTAVEPGSPRAQLDGPGVSGSKMGVVIDKAYRTSRGIGAARIDIQPTSRAASPLRPESTRSVDSPTSGR